MPRPGVEFRLATIVLLLVLGTVVVAVLATDWAADALALPAAGLLFGGLCLAWEGGQGARGRQP